MANKLDQAQEALDQIEEQIHHAASTKKAKPGGAQAGLGAGFNGKKFFGNLLTIAKIAEPFFPGPGGAVVKAIETAISELSGNATAAPSADDNE